MQISKRIIPTLLATAAMTAAGTAQAQSSLCGGLGASGEWVGGAEAASDIATADSFREQMALVTGGGEYVSLFSLSAITDTRIEAQGRGSGDPVIDVYDNAGALILSDDDSGGNGASRGEAVLDPGTYCVAVRSYDGGPMTSFVRVGRFEHEALTDGVEAVMPEQSSEACATAPDLGGLGASVTGSASESPYWQFTLDTATALSMTAENENADPVMTLYDADGNIIAENDDFDGLNSRIDMASALAAGNYCIGITALSDDTLPITVSVEAYDPEAVLMGLYARGEASPPLGGPVPITDLGKLDSRLRYDAQVTGDVSWYALDIMDVDLLVIEAIGSGGTDPWLVVFDDLGRQVGMNDDHNDSLDAMVTSRVQDGTYLIGLRQYEGGQGFVRLLAEGYVRAR